VSNISGHYNGAPVPALGTETNQPGSKRRCPLIGQMGHDGQRPKRPHLIENDFWFPFARKKGQSHCVGSLTTLA
jgi:hypothetical protein